MRIRLLSVGVLFVLSLSALPSASAAKDPVVPTSWANLEKNYKGIAYGAWKKSSLEVASATPVQVKINSVIGPKSFVVNKNPQAAINLASRLFSKKAHPKAITFVFFTFADVAWAQRKIEEFTNSDPNVVDEAKHLCESPTRCESASARLNGNLDAIILIAMSNWTKTDVNHTSGTLEAHEFTHTIQDQPGGIAKKWVNAPTWIYEGHAEFAQAAAIYANSFPKYSTERNRIIVELKQSSMYSPAWLQKFINPSNWENSHTAWAKYPGWRVYDVGFLASEILVSLKGPDSVIEMLEKISKGDNYATAFEKVYGIAWKEAVPLISKVIAKELKG